MHIEDVELFERIAALRSVSKAAQALNIGNTVASERLARLERELGCTLASRTTRRLSLTSEGETFLTQAVGLLEQYNSTRNSVGKRANLPAGRIRVTAPTVFGRLHLLGPVTAYLKSNADVTVDLLLSDDVLDYAQEGIDVAIRIGELNDSTFRATKMGDNHRVVCASPAYLVEHGTPQKPDDLKDHDCLVFGEERTWHLSNRGRTVPVKVTGRLSSSNGDIIREAALAGLGVALRSTWDVQSQLDSGALVRVLPAWKASIGMNIWAIYPPGKYISRGSKEFVRLIKEALITR